MENQTIKFEMKMTNPEYYLRGEFNVEDFENGLVNLDLQEFINQHRKLKASKTELINDTN